MKKKQQIKELKAHNRELEQKLFVSGLDYDKYRALSEKLQSRIDQHLPLIGGQSKILIEIMELLGIEKHETSQAIIPELKHLIALKSTDDYKQELAKEGDKIKAQKRVIEGLREEII